MSDFHEHAKAAIAAIGERRFDEAVAAFTRAVELAPERPDMNHGLAMAHLHRGDMLSAIPPLERAVALSEPFTAPQYQEMRRDYHLQLAATYQVADRTADAERTLRAAIDRWPDAAEPWLRLAQLYGTSCRLEAAVTAWRQAVDRLEGEQKTAAEALLGAIDAFRASEAGSGATFLRAHAESYREYFNQVAEEQAKNGWFAEGARMAHAVDSGELVPVVTEGARPWALTRADLINPSDGNVHSVYSETEPMIVALEGLEPLAQVPVLFPWEGQPFEVWVCSQAPWHWLNVLVQFRRPADSEEALVDRLDERIGAWYLDGYNGVWGDADKGRFHYATDPSVVGDRAVHYVFDLGRASYDAIEALIHRLVVLHDAHPIQRVIFGTGRLPPD